MITEKGKGFSKFKITQINEQKQHQGAAVLNGHMCLYKGLGDHGVGTVQSPLSEDCGRRGSSHNDVAVPSSSTAGITETDLTS